jgi:hypothetical protein
MAHNSTRSNILQHILVYRPILDDVTKPFAFVRDQHGCSRTGGVDPWSILAGRAQWRRQIPREWPYMTPAGFHLILCLSGGAGKVDLARALDRVIAQQEAAAAQEQFRMQYDVI